MVHVESETKWFNREVKEIKRLTLNENTHIMLIMQ